MQQVTSTTPKVTLVAAKVPINGAVLVKPSSPCIAAEDAARAKAQTIVAPVVVMHESLVRAPGAPEIYKKITCSFKVRNLSC